MKGSVTSSSDDLASKARDEIGGFAMKDVSRSTFPNVRWERLLL